MTKRKDIQSGAVMQVPLHANRGYGYVKLIFSKDICQNGMTCLIVKLYNKYAVSPLTPNSFNATEFETDDLLTYPYLMLSYPPLRGADKWRLLGTAKLTEEDHIVPDYIQSWKFGGISELELMVQCKTKHGCGIVRNFQNKRIYTKEFEQIKHIGQWMHYHHSSITDILTVSHFDNMGMSMLDIFTKEDIEKDFWKPIVQAVAIERQQYFKDMPKISRLKVLMS